MHNTWKRRGLSLEGREPLGPPEDLMLRAEVLLLIMEVLLRAESRTEALRLRAEASGVSQPVSESRPKPLPIPPNTPSCPA